MDIEIWESAHLYHPVLIQTLVSSSKIMLNVACSITYFVALTKEGVLLNFYGKPPVLVLENKIRPFSVLVPHINGTKNSVPGPVLQKKIHIWFWFHLKKSDLVLVWFSVTQIETDGYPLINPQL